MTVTALEPHGFCSGVKAAIDKALHALADSACAKKGLYCLHALVHNERVLADFRQQGLIFVDSLAEIPSGATVIFSAHGVGPQVRQQAQERGLTCVDATCPFVARIHHQVVTFATRGMPVVVVGDVRHIEVQGTCAEARAAGAQVGVVHNLAEVDALPFAPEVPVGVVCQTTFDAAEIQVLLKRLHARYPHLETPPVAAVCTATRDRQMAVRNFVHAGGDGVLVLGSPSSANTCRLASIAEEAGARAWRVGSLAELSACSWAGIQHLGVTAGASTPETFFSAAFDQLVKDNYS